MRGLNVLMSALLGIGIAAATIGLAAADHQDDRWECDQIPAYQRELVEAMPDSQIPRVAREHRVALVNHLSVVSQALLAWGTGGMFAVLPYAESIEQANRLVGSRTRTKRMLPDPPRRKPDQTTWKMSIAV